MRVVVGSQEDHPSESNPKEKLPKDQSMKNLLTQWETEVENQKIVAALDLLAPGGALRKS